MPARNQPRFEYRPVITSGERVVYSQEGEGGGKEDVSRATLLSFNGLMAAAVEDLSAAGDCVRFEPAGSS